MKNLTSVFQKRVAFKPFEYPEVAKFKDAINHSYWLVSEWNFLSDIQDFKVKLNSVEQNAIRNSLLAISQVEVAVKKFWANLGNKFPKPELDQVGVTFGECEVRHADAYSHLLTVLNLNDDFAKLLENPVIQGRVDYLSKYLAGANSDNNQKYTLSLTLFSIFIENVSLFSQFAIIKSFNKHKNVLKDIDNVVQATQKEELVHAMFGMWLINKIKEENPDWFDEAFYDKIYAASKKAYKAEEKIIDWIFEKGELSFIKAAEVKELVKDRLNESVVAINGKPIFEVDKKTLNKLKWFNEEIYAQTQVDFFNKKSVNYAKRNSAITENDLF